MKNSKVLLIVILAVSIITGGVLTSTAHARDLRIDNYSGMAVTGIYVSQDGRRSWGYNNLGGKSLPHGGTWTIRQIPVSSSSRYWDVRIDFSDGTYYRWWGKDLSSYSRMSVYKRGSDMYADWN